MTGAGTQALDGLNASLEKMRRHGVPNAALETFRDYYERLQTGDAGMLPESAIEPLGELPELERLPGADAAAGELLDHAVVLKLNGGLGTSMGLSAPKSLLEVKEGLTFLDIIVRQVTSLRRRFGVRLPLVLMNSFATHDQTMAALERYADLATDVPVAFLQNRFPKLSPADLRPVSWPADPELEWAPPGHGDLYTAIVASGTLETLLDRDYRYAFVSNADNLGATLDQRILGWFAFEKLPFLMEVADRTPADRKGGHLALGRHDGLVLRESAQTPEQDMPAFEDVTRHRLFNTNNVWLDLRALEDLVSERGGVKGLPMIVNRKPVDPSDPSTPEVIQVESAMGAAIATFEHARAVGVPRRRFAPVKTTNDLLAVRSDAYVLTGDGRVTLAPARGERPPIIDLNGRFYKLLAEFERRLPAGPPSLVACERLTVVGDVVFGRGVVVRGTVSVEHQDGQLRIDDGKVLEG